MLTIFTSPPDIGPARLVVLIALAALGLVMWAGGAKALRPTLAALGLVVGAGVGWVSAEALTAGGALIVEPWVTALIIGVLGACVGALVYRLAIAMALAGLLGLLLPTAVVVLHGLGHLPLGDDASTVGGGPRVVVVEPTTPEEADPAIDWLFPDSAQDLRDLDAGDAGQALLDFDADLDAGQALLPPALAPLRLADRLGLDAGGREQLSGAREKAEDAARATRAGWEGLPETLRPLLVIAAILGVLAGLVLATFAPTASAIAVTAMFGALFGLASLREILVGLGSPPDLVMPPGPVPALAGWLIASAAGMAIQWTFRPKTVDRRR